MNSMCQVYREIIREITVCWVDVEKDTEYYLRSQN